MKKSIIRFFFLLALCLLSLSVPGTDALAQSADEPTVFINLGDGADGIDLRSLLRYGDRFYGTMGSNWPDLIGSVFSVALDGSDFTILHSFGQFDVPAGLLELNGTLYGLIQLSDNSSVFFSMDIDGTNFTTLHSFSGTSPRLSFTYNSKIYGLISEGNYGSFFSISPDGSGYEIFPFADGFVTPSSFIVSGDKFYGSVSGMNRRGIVRDPKVFSVNPDGTDITILHSFDVLNGDVIDNQIDVNVYDGRLYVAASTDPSGSEGLFSMGLDGSGFRQDYLFQDIFVSGVGNNYSFGIFDRGSFYVNVSSSSTINVINLESLSLNTISTGDFSTERFFVIGRVLYAYAYNNHVDPALFNIFSWSLPTLSYSAGPGGSISGLSSQHPGRGTDGAPVTAVTDSGYRFTSWSDSSTENPRTDHVARADVSVSASFEPAPVVATAAPRARSGGRSSSRRQSAPSSSSAVVPGVAAETRSDVSQSSSVPSSSGLSLNRTVGSSGPDVRSLQTFLNSRGFRVSDSGAGSPGLETDFFGPRTRDALARFQASAGISPAFGFLGPVTRAYMQALP